MGPKRLLDLGSDSFDGSPAYDLASGTYSETEGYILSRAYSYLSGVLAVNGEELQRHKLIHGNLIFDILADSDINAFAVHRNGNDYILLNSGLVLSLYMLFARLAQFPQALSWLDPLPATARTPAPLASIPATIAQLVAEAERAAREGYPVTPIVTDVQSRRDCAALIWRASLLFVLFHELGHLLHGHADFLCSQVRASVFREIGNPTQSVGAGTLSSSTDQEWFELRQGQEGQADQFAVLTTFLPIFLGPAPAPFLASRTARGFNRFPYVWGFALSTVFTLFAFLDGVVRYDDSGREHPEPFERLTNAAFSPGLMMSAYGIESDPSLGAEIMSGWHDVDALFGMAFKGTFREFFSNETNVIPFSASIVTREFPHQSSWSEYDRLTPVLAQGLRLQIRVGV